MKVYIGKTPEGSVIVDTNPKVLTGVELLLSMPFEDYLALGHHEVEAAIEDGKAVLRLKESVAKHVEIARYKASLEAIDKEAGAGRDLREMMLNMANILSQIVTGFDPEEDDSLKRIKSYEEEAGIIREQLRPLLESEEK